MSLEQWKTNGWLRGHTTSSKEIKNLLEIVERDLKDASANDISNDWKFGIAYNAALKLCTIMLYSAGFRPKNTLAHYRTLQSIEFTLGAKRKADAAYLDACRIKRNTVEYDYIGGASYAEALELLEFTLELKEDVMSSLKKNHPDLLN